MPLRSVSPLPSKGRGDETFAAPRITFESSLALGDVWALDQLWHELGFDRLAGVFRRARFTSPVEHAVRAMVFNRLCDADSKLGVLRWLQTVAMPGIDAAALTHQQLLRSMDALMDHQEAVDDCVACLLRPLIDTELSVVFYDLTTIRAAGESSQDGDVRRFGMSKEGVIARQFLLGVVQTAEGLPIFHEVFEGNASEGKTLEPTLAKVLARYPQIERLIVVADRGLLSLDNVEQLSRIVLPSGKRLEFILAVVVHIDPLGRPERDLGLILVAAQQLPGGTPAAGIVTADAVAHPSLIEQGHQPGAGVSPVEHQYILGPQMLQRLKQHLPLIDRHAMHTRVQRHLRARREHGKQLLLRTSGTAQHLGLPDGGHQGRGIGGHHAQAMPQRQQSQSLRMRQDKGVEVLQGGRIQAITGLGKGAIGDMALPALAILQTHGGKEAVQRDLLGVIAHGQQHRNQGGKR